MASIRIPQNPGIGGLDELTLAEELVVQQIAGLGDPNADRILFWDDSAGSFAYLSVGSGLDLKGTTLTATGGVGGGITRTVTVTSGSFTAGSGAAVDYIYLIAGAHNVTLPTASSNTNRYTFKNNHSAAITITRAGADTVEGASSIQVAPEDSVDLISNGTSGWYVI